MVWSLDSNLDSVWSRSLDSDSDDDDDDDSTLSGCDSDFKSLSEEKRSPREWPVMNSDYLLPSTRRSGS